MKRHNGAILPFCLVFLTLLGLMAVAGLESLLLHERMLANARRSHDGFEAAEAALRAGEAEIDRQCPGFSVNAVPPPDGLIWRQVVELTPQWWENRGIEANFAGADSPAPRYFVEFWRGSATSPGAPAPVYYRITARASARTPAAASVLQALGVATCNGAQTITRNRLSWRRLG